MLALLLFLVCMSSHVSYKLGLIKKCSEANLTLKWLFPGMGAHVQRQFGSRFERLSGAHFALVAGLTSVSGYMST